MRVKKLREIEHNIRELLEESVEKGGPGSGRKPEGRGTTTTGPTGTGRKGSSAKDYESLSEEQAAKLAEKTPMSDVMTALVESHDTGVISNIIQERCDQFYNEPLSNFVAEINKMPLEALNYLDNDMDGYISHVQENTEGKIPKGLETRWGKIADAINAKTGKSLEKGGPGSGRKPEGSYVNERMLSNNQIKDLEQVGNEGRKAYWRARKAGKNHTDAMDVAMRATEK